MTPIIEKIKSILSETEQKAVIKAWQETYGDLYNENDIAEYEWVYAFNLIKKLKSKGEK